MIYLSTNAELIEWMEHEGFDAFALLRITPRPKARSVPASVVMEWGVADRGCEWRVSEGPSPKRGPQETRNGPQA